ncbi:short-chain dehydrogenase/reductase [Burkholderia multivorans]|jgi:NAD(P)-dependent dehydrogenase (short-subunit alcohol dehydrogenase family)|uniref:short-chain dehydrogenase/reductase n=1 Tax=Burkholderia multivorans TaxID=87883 RepID=UPI000580966B|nr:short-chain dehydrogenase/reductase [Burkholderia multivorans]KHS15791.1 short-chain dehydrogenase [Burkholderia multivorans]KHS19025.1 short-chain dehydrogenase [Burkholderia multivorans]MBR7920808.1 SDR family oxidoreductase [Burkholderia multivorans]MBR8105530.1 SDR family oxidoreductase [Burkholderia multivorans]MBR8341019.1 SDR family oxidoreductase [Burkholderia multivorans]
MDLELSGKNVLITGATRGIGFACASTFAREGSRVVIVGRERGSVDDAVDRLNTHHGADVEGMVADVATEDGRKQLQQRLESVDILVNNAGAIPGGGLENIDDTQWRAAWELKVFGYINLTRAALPSMMARGSGVVLNIVGIAGVMPNYDYLCGSAGNAALVAFTQAVGAHATERGVRVLGVNPGPTETERLVSLSQARAAQRFGDASRWPDMLTNLPFGRAAKPHEIADLVAFLASARASYLSGVVIDADGGGRYAA